MAVDGPVRDSAAPTPRNRVGKLPAQQTGYMAGCKALDSLDRLITSTESFFHPSNSGPWTTAVSPINLVLPVYEANAQF
jgi:proteasome activator subunit 4